MAFSAMLPPKGFYLSFGRSSPLWTRDEANMIPPGIENASLT
jgi:hypothetical protein